MICPLLSSRPEESHPRALPDPCVNLSIHTASDVQPLAHAASSFTSSTGLLLLPVGFSWPVASVEQCSPFAPAPLQDLHHYYGLLRPCAPHRYSRPHGFSRLRLLPLHRCDRFSRSIQEPGWASRRLHAGYRSGRLQGSPELIPEDGSAPGFDIV